MDHQTTYSLGQTLFFFTGLLVAPAFALAGLFLGARRINLIARAAIPFFAVEATLVTLAAIGFSMHPDYPVNGPPERLVAWLVVVAHLAGAAAVHLLSRADDARSGQERAPRAIALIAGAAWALASAVSVVVGMVSVMPPRLSLPDDAANVRETLVGRGFTSTHDYTLGADMSAASFHAYGARLGLASSGPDTYAYGDERCQIRAFYDGRRMLFTSRCR